MEWARILAYITATVDQELLLRNEYLAAEKALAAFLDRCRRRRCYDCGFWLLRDLVTYRVLFFIHLESRRVDIAGITNTYVHLYAYGSYSAAV